MRWGMSMSELTGGGVPSFFTFAARLAILSNLHAKLSEANRLLAAQWCINVL